MVQEAGSVGNGSETEFVELVWKQSSLGVDLTADLQKRQNMEACVTGLPLVASEGVLIDLVSEFGWKAQKR
jgi:hypothetical protein